MSVELADHWRIEPIRVEDRQSAILPSYGYIEEIRIHPQMKPWLKWLLICAVPVGIAGGIFYVLSKGSVE